jgi:hypothetical protein
MRSTSPWFVLAAAAALTVAAAPAVAGCGMGGGHAGGGGGHGHGGHHGAGQASSRAAEARRQSAAATAWPDLRVGDVGRWDEWRRSDDDGGGAASGDYTDQIALLARAEAADEAACRQATIESPSCADRLRLRGQSWPPR